MLVAGWAQPGDAMRPLASRLGEILSGDYSFSCHGVLDFASETDREVSYPSIYARTLASRLTGEETVIGWSMGGIVALEVACAFPGLMRRLVLVSATPTFVAGRNNSQGVPRTNLNALKMGLRVAPEKILKKFFAHAYGVDNGDESMVLGKTAAALSFGAPTLLDGLTFLDRVDLQPHLGQVDIPVLLVHGTKDVIISHSSVDLLQAGLQDCTTFLLENRGHGFIETHPETMCSVVGDFVANA